MQRTAEPGLFPIHHRSDMKIRADHHIANARIAPDDAFGAVGRAFLQQSIKGGVQQCAFAFGIYPVFEAPPAINFLIKTIGAAGQCQKTSVRHRHCLNRRQLLHRALPQMPPVRWRDFNQPARFGIRRIADRDPPRDFLHHKEGRTKDRVIGLKPERLGHPHRAIGVHQLDQPILLVEHIVAINQTVGRLDPYNHAV